MTYRSSWKLGHLAGIPLYVHWTFFLLLGWVLLATLFEVASLLTAVASVLFVAAIFGCVVLHELGHALTARRFGIGTQDITLLPIGGVARLERIPEDPRQEFLVAIAGPAVNAAIAALLWVMIGFADRLALLWGGTVSGGFFTQLVYVNIGLIIFNLLPAFPMDGGRILRSLLAQRISYLEATRIACKVGRGMAVLFGIAGLFINPMLILIALFVWVGAGQELNLVEYREALRRQQSRRPFWPTPPGSSPWVSRAERVGDQEPLGQEDPTYRHAPLIKTVWISRGPLKF